MEIAAIVYMQTGMIKINTAVFIAGVVMVDIITHRIEMGVFIIGDSDFKIIF